MFLKTIVFYKKNLSVLGYCRLYPSCSDYAYAAIKKKGIFVGLWESTKRILKCNSLLTPVVGTYDPVN